MKKMFMFIHSNEINLSDCLRVSLVKRDYNAYINST
jgi:hypothetical protein